MLIGLRRASLVVFSALTLIAGCGPSISRVTPGSPVSGQKVQVTEFDVSGAQVSSYDGPTDTYGMEIAQKIAEALRQAGVDAAAVPRGAPLMAQVIVEGQVTTIDGGSRSLRYFVGFGAGATRFAVRGKARRAEGQVLGEFADERRSGFGIFGGDTSTLMHRCTETVGYDVATMVTTGQYR